MPRFFRRRLSRSRVARRRTAWSHETQTFASSASDQSVDLLTDFKGVMGLTANPLGITIRRIKLIIQIDFDLSTNALSHTSGVYLTTHVNTGGLASGSVPDAVNNPDKDYNFRVWLPASGGMGANTVPASHIFISREYDVKSMRKLRDLGDTMYFSFIPTGGASVALQLEASTLLLLP